MHGTMARYQEALLFIIDEAVPTDDQEATSSYKRSSYWKPVRSSSILLPQLYLEQLPTILSLCRLKNITIIDESNVNRLLVDGDKIEAIAILMDDRQSSSVDPLEVLIPLSAPHPSGLGDNIRVRKGEPDTDYIKSVLDTSTRAVIKQLAGRRPELRCHFHFQRILGGCGTLLHLAASRCDVEFARLLIQSGAAVNSTGLPSCSTPLHFAAMNSSGAEMVQFLIEHGADVNAVKDSGLLPLHVASNELYESLSGNVVHRIPVIKMLLDLGSLLVPRDVSKNYGLLQSCFLLSESGVLKYLLERCFIEAQLLQDHPIFDMFVEAFREQDDAVHKNFRIFCQHLQKITTLENHLNSNADCILVNGLSAAEGFSDLCIPKFAEECEAEIALLKNQKLGDTDVPVLELLEKKEQEVALLLRNKSVYDIAQSHELATQFPIYGNILDYHLAKGVFRKSMQADLMKCCRLFSELFRKLPDELQTRTLTYFSLQDVLMLKRAAACHETSN